MTKNVQEMLGLSRGGLFVIAGPCVIESMDICLQIGRQMQSTCRELGLTYIFKASFDKANRSSVGSYRGLSMQQGLEVLGQIRQELKVPVLTDVHESSQPEVVGKYVDVLQVPAFLARQTDLLLACGRTGKAVNVKKGQFMSPQEMQLAVDKIRSTGNQDILLTERGTFFGYNRLVNDFTGLAVMKQTGCPVVFDVTHSTQQPAGLGGSSGGNPQYAPMLARAAVAAGVDGLFIECHPEPAKALSDAATMLALKDVPALLKQVQQIAELRKGW
jgi:2-dehydro-3-deoxyphosphooctonate aldolase (KDO 8-P synthase)